MSRRRKRAHGNGTVVPPKKVGGPWGIRYTEGAKRKFKGGFANREIAERVLAKIAGEAAVGRSFLPPDRSKSRTLEEFAEPFLKARKMTHAAAYEDHIRWKKHLKPWFGHLRPHEVTTAAVRAFVEAKLIEELNPATIRICVSLLRSLFRRLVDDREADANPVNGLSKDITRMYKPTYDPATTPFIEKLEDVWRIHRRLPEPLNIAFALGAMAGLRPGELLALEWRDIDINTRRIQVLRSVKGRVKDREPRTVPIIDALKPVLVAWKLKSGGKGLVLPPMRIDGEHVSGKTLSAHLRPVLKDLGLERDGLGWYESTRHTFASQWVMNGGSIEKLKEILGHYSVVVTERYAHLRPDLFTAKDLATIPVEAGGDVEAKSKDS